MQEEGGVLLPSQLGGKCGLSSPALGGGYSGTSSRPKTCRLKVERLESRKA